MFFRFFPPVRFYLRATKGIEKLTALNEDVFDDRGNPATQKQGSLQRGDVGFTELCTVLKQNVQIEDEITAVTLVQDEAGILIGNSPNNVTELLLNRNDKEPLIFDPFNPDKPIHDLRNWVEDAYRIYLARYMIYGVVMWLLANSLMLYLLNK